jgi:hypothetical protein
VSRSYQNVEMPWEKAPLRRCSNHLVPAWLTLGKSTAARGCPIVVLVKPAGTEEYGLRAVTKRGRVIADRVCPRRHDGNRHEEEPRGALCVRTVTAEFRDKHRVDAKSLGWESISVVGPTVAVVHRLDAMPESTTTAPPPSGGALAVESVHSPPSRLRRRGRRDEESWHDGRHFKANHTRYFSALR